MIKVLKNLEKKHLGYIAICIAFIVAQVWLDLKLPDYMKEITALVQTPGSAMKDVLTAGGKMMLCAFGSLATAVIVGYFAAKVSAGLSRKLRKKVYHKTMSFSMEEMNKFSTPSLITRSTNDITQIQMFIAIGLQALIKAPIMAVWAIMKISNKSWQWTFSTGIAVLIIVILLATVLVLTLPKFRMVQNLTDNLNRVSRENITGVRVVRAYNAEKYQEGQFEKANLDLTKTHLFIGRTMSFMMPMMGFVMSSLSLAIYWIGVYLIDKADMLGKIDLFSDMIVFSSYAMQVIMAFMFLIMVFIILPRASVSAKRISEVLDTNNSIVSGEGSNKPASEGEIEFRNVSFRYPDAADYVIENVSFKIKKGQTLAFIGATGSGKSTLLNLIPRFYDATDGEVLVDGINVKDYKLEELRDRLGYVSQKAVLFSGDVSSNVVYGDNGKQAPAEEQVKKAIAVAQAEEFVEKMAGGLAASIAQGGTNVSGGQKQRLSIARAVCRDPEIYLFDDSFSALDYKTDRLLRTALKKETGDATSVIVAQRIGTIMDADCIVVLDDGKAVGMGTHKELLKSCEVYREIAESQLSKEEIENAWA